VLSDYHFDSHFINYERYIMKIELCKRCHSKVIKTPKIVTKGYYAFCKNHYEDLDKCETYIKPKKGALL